MHARGHTYTHACGWAHVRKYVNTQAACPGHASNLSLHLAEAHLPPFLLLRHAQADAPLRARCIPRLPELQRLHCLRRFQYLPPHSANTVQPLAHCRALAGQVHGSRPEAAAPSVRRPCRAPGRGTSFSQANLQYTSLQHEFAGKVALVTQKQTARTHP